MNDSATFTSNPLSKSNLLEAFGHRYRIPTENDHAVQKWLQHMWDGGPLRQCSNRQAGGHYVAYSSPILTGYAGSYVCDQCKRPCAGVYLVGPAKSWLCGPCKGSVQRVDSGREPVKPVQQFGDEPEPSGTR
jgi:hypothetical protein